MFRFQFTMQIARMSFVINCKKNPTKKLNIKKSSSSTFKNQLFYFRASFFNLRWINLKNIYCQLYGLRCFEFWKRSPYVEGGKIKMSKGAFVLNMWFYNRRWKLLEIIAWHVFFKNDYWCYEKYPWKSSEFVHLEEEDEKKDYYMV